MESGRKKIQALLFVENVESLVTTKLRVPAKTLIAAASPPLSGLS